MKKILSLSLLVLLFFALIFAAHAATSTGTGDQHHQMTSSLIQAVDQGADTGAIQAADEIVYITNTGSKYHRKGCSYLKKSCIPIKKSEAIAKGYTACKRCKP